MVDEEPSFFLDRSVGTKRVAAGLRDLGPSAQTVDDRYGVAAGPTVADEQWITDASRDGLLPLGADLRIRYRTVERWALCRAHARYVAFSRGNLTAQAMVERVAAHLRQIQEAATTPGPWVRHLTVVGLRAVALDCSDLPR